MNSSRCTASSFTREGRALRPKLDPKQIPRVLQILAISMPFFELTAIDATEGLLQKYESLLAARLSSRSQLSARAVYSVLRTLVDVLYLYKHSTQQHFYW